MTGFSLTFHAVKNFGNEAVVMISRGIFDPRLSKFDPLKCD
jgi:hypothetical protein